MKLKLLSLGLLFILASSGLVVCGERVVTVEDSCQIGKDGREIEASRKTIHRVTIPLNSNNHDHLTFFHDGAPKDCEDEICKPKPVPVSTAAGTSNKTAVAKPQAGSSATGSKPDSEARDREELLARQRKWLADVRNHQMFEYNLGRLHELEREEKFYLGVAIGGGIIMLVEVAKAIRAK